MKKFLALILSLVMVVSLAACGGGTSSSGDQSAEPYASLTEAYNAAAILYNKIAIAADKNGWMVDEKTATDLADVKEVLGMIGTALTGDASALEGENPEELTQSVVELVPGLEVLLERVSKPYTAE